MRSRMSLLSETRFSKMSTLHITIPHRLAQEEALTRIKRLLGRLQKELSETIRNVYEEWTANDAKFSFTAKGFTISGTIHVGPDSVALAGKLPAMLTLFKGKITTVIRQKADELLS
jgi:hypothetical protein